MKIRLLGIIGGMGTVAILASPAASATKLTGFSTFGADMGGMEITVNLFDGTTETSIWNSTSTEGGRALGNHWSLTQSGNTFGDFGNDWNFSYGGSSRVVALIIDAIPGNTVFDNVPVDELTPGSADGWDFQVTLGLAPSRHEYSAEIDISEGDLFGRLSLFWDDGFTGEMHFLADTDSGKASDPVTPKDPLPPLPEPPQPPAISVPEPAISPEPISVPEPAVVLGLLAFAGASARVKR